MTTSLHSVTETGEAIEVVVWAVYRLGWVAPQRSIPPLPGLDPAWLSSAQPAPLPVAAQSQWTGGVTLAVLHPEMVYHCNTLNSALEVVWEGWETVMQKRDSSKKNPRKINCRQCLIDRMSGAGTVIQATHRGGRKALWPLE